MDELMRYVLKRTVEKVGIESLTTLCSNEKWSLDRKALALSLFIYQRQVISLSILEFTPLRIVNEKKLFDTSELAIIRKQAASDIDTMTTTLMRQCRQYAECIFDETEYAMYMNRLQLCYLDRGRWRRFRQGIPSTASVFGSVRIRTQIANGVRKPPELTAKSKRVKTKSSENAFA